jgi:hypothetical protein
MSDEVLNASIMLYGRNVGERIALGSNCHQFLGGHNNNGLNCHGKHFYLFFRVEI